MASFQNEPDRFDELADSLQAHPSKAQILVETDASADALDEVITLLNSAGFHHVEHKVLLEENPACILLYIRAKDITEAIYSLIEAGYIKVKGINPQTKSENGAMRL